MWTVYLHAPSQKLSMSPGMVTQTGPYCMHLGLEHPLTVQPLRRDFAMEAGQQDAFDILLNAGTRFAHSLGTLEFVVHAAIVHVASGAHAHAQPRTPTYCPCS
jgi:hypothetical protein